MTTIYLHGNIEKPSLPGDIGCNIRIPEAITPLPGKVTVVSTGAFVSMPEGVGGLLKLRSGFAILNPVILNGGVIDTGYSGELKLALINVGDTNITIYPEKAIAQIVFITVPSDRHIYKADLEFFQELTQARNHIRGTHGFGSTDR